MLNGERIDHWLSVGALPTDKVKVLIKKYGSGGTHLQQQEAALAKLSEARRRPEPPKVESKPEASEKADASEKAAVEQAPEPPAAEAAPVKPAEESASEETTE